jgi:UDP-2,3-diacylglucosamine hydrolase
VVPPQKDWIFISDAHFTGREPEEVKSFLGFLDTEEDRMGHLVILGDLFEFFFGFKSSFPEKRGFSDYLPVLERLQRLDRQGIRIVYFEGNHDFSLQSFFSEQWKMEVKVYPEGAEERLGEKRAFLAHGDLSNPKQWKYRIYRRLLKNRWAYALIHFVGPDVSRRVAQRLSSMSYQKSHARKQVSPPVFKAFAHQKFLEGFEVVILGHSHFPEEVEERIDGRRCLYFNVGDWKTHRSFLRFTPPERYQLSRYVEKG